LDEKRDKVSVYERMINIETLSEDFMPNEKPLIDMSFTYLDWNVID